MDTTRPHSGSARNISNTPQTCATTPSLCIQVLNPCAGMMNPGVKRSATAPTHTAHQQQIYGQPGIKHHWLVSRALSAIPTWPTYTWQPVTNLQGDLLQLSGKMFVRHRVSHTNCQV